MTHTCHAEACTVPVPPKMFMCREHWYMVPKVDRDLVWALYVPGQEIRKDPSLDYLNHVLRVIYELAIREGVEPDSALDPELPFV